MMGFPVFQIFSFLEAVLKFLATWIFLATFYAGWRVWKKRVAFQAELKCVHCKLSRSCSQTREQWWKHGGETSTCMWKDYGPGVLSFTSWKKCSSTFICFKSLVGNVETLMWRFLPFEIIWDFCLDEISMRKTMRFMRKNHPNWTIWFPKVRFTQNSLDGISYHFSTGMIIDYNYIVIYLYTFHDWNANSPDFVLGVDQHFLLHLSFLLKKTAGCLLLVAWLKTCCGVAFVAPPHDWLKEAGDLELEGKKARHFHRFSTCSWKGAISEDINVNVNQCYVDMVVFWVHKKCDNSQLSIDSICFNIRLSVPYPWRPFLLILKKVRTWPHAATKKWKPDRAHLPKNENLTPQTYQKVKKPIPQTAKNDQNTNVDLTQPHKSVKFMKARENGQRGTMKKQISWISRHFLVAEEFKKWLF